MSVVGIFYLIPIWSSTGGSGWYNVARLVDAPMDLSATAGVVVGAISLPCYSIGLDSPFSKATTLAWFFLG
jgi:hypothetical protein